MRIRNWNDRLARLDQPPSRSSTCSSHALLTIDLAAARTGTWTLGLR